MLKALKKAWEYQQQQQKGVAEIHSRWWWEGARRKKTAAHRSEFQKVNNFRVGFEFGHVTRCRTQSPPDKKYWLFLKFLIYYLHNIDMKYKVYYNTELPSIWFSQTITEKKKKLRN